MPFDASVPNIARVYEYDKEFVTRAASWAARQGVAQFLDFGAFDITFDGRLSAGRKWNLQDQLHRRLHRPLLAGAHASVLNDDRVGLRRGGA